MVLVVVDVLVVEVVGKVVVLVLVVVGFSVVFLFHPQLDPVVVVRIGLSVVDGKSESELQPKSESHSEPESYDSVLVVVVVVVLVEVVVGVVVVLRGVGRLVVVVVEVVVSHGSSVLAKQKITCTGWVELSFCVFRRYLNF